MTDSRPNVLIALGANLSSSRGTPEKTLISAVSAVHTHGMILREVSRFFLTPCYPPGAGPDYVNAVIGVTTALSPAGVLAELHEIESNFGRRRDTRWGMRTLDLDLLAYEDRVLPDAATQGEWMNLPADQQRLRAPGQLIVPHPRMQDRAFVLVPLVDIAPNWRHPVLGKTARQLLAAVPDAEISGVRPI